MIFLFAREMIHRIENARSNSKALDERKSSYNPLCGSALRPAHQSAN
jgi:hypothetical protein